ncbi:MAG: hypothetical protein LPK26_03190 [Bacillaceae bacterium]|nr:hypothetical protein [Bacillaceae bacterium]
MNASDLKTNYSSLLMKKQYYQKKALDVEKTLIFTEEKVSSLQSEIHLLKKELKQLESITEGHNAEKKNAKRVITHLENEIEHLQKQLIDIKNEYDIVNKEKSTLLEELDEKERVINELVLKQKALENEVNELNVRETEMKEDENKMIIQQYQEQIKGFEMLLKEVQDEINKKEQEIEGYKSKIASLQKQPSFLANDDLPNHYNGLEDKNSAGNSNQMAVAYFNYAVIFNQDQRSCVVRSDFYMKNVGTVELHDPYICFRFFPYVAAEIKGKIMSMDRLETGKIQNSEKHQWMFIENEWAKKAKERGEIWVKSLNKMTISPGEEVSIDQFQFLLDRNMSDNINVQAFIYCKQQDYKCKSSNQITLNI